MTQPLSGKRVLIVEDEYLFASLLQELVEMLGAHAVGPFAHTAPALQSLENDDGVDIALLDVNLGSETSFPVADVLLRRAVPTVLVTGYDRGELPPRYQSFPHLSKPLDCATLTSMMVRLAENTPVREVRGH